MALDLGSPDTQAAREHVRSIATLWPEDPGAVHLTLALNGILRRLDALERQVAELRWQAGAEQELP